MGKRGVQVEKAKPKGKGRGFLYRAAALRSNIAATLRSNVAHGVYRGVYRTTNINAVSSIVRAVEVVAGTIAVAVPNIPRVART